MLRICGKAAGKRLVRYQCGGDRQKHGARKGAVRQCGIWAGADRQGVS